MFNKTNVALLILIVIISLLIPLSAGSKPFTNKGSNSGIGIPLYGCSNLNTQNTTYYLAKNIQTTSTCFNITADDIVLDGNGKIVYGDGEENDYAITSETSKRVTVKNFKIQNFGYGIFFSENTEDINIEKNNLYSNNIGIVAYDAVVEKNFLLNSHLIAITNADAIRLNSILDSESHGIVYTSRNGGSIQNNEVINTGSNAIALRFGTENVNVENNKVINAHTGLFVQNAEYNNLNNNILNSTNYGVIIDNSLETNIYGGEIVDSSEDAILLAGVAGPVLNTTIDNVIIQDSDNSSFDIRMIVGNEDGTVLINTNVEKYFLAGNIVTFREDGTGEIVFSEEIFGAGNDLSEEIVILNNFVSVDSDSNPGFNKSAQITLFNSPGANFTNPVILMNGVKCPTNVCTPLTPLDAETVIFNVTHWTSYEIGEGAQSENIQDNCGLSLNNGGDSACRGIPVSISMLLSIARFSHIL